MPVFVQIEVGAALVGERRQLAAAVAAEADQPTAERLRAFDAGDDPDRPARVGVDLEPVAATSRNVAPLRRRRVDRASERVRGEDLEERAAASSSEASRAPRTLIVGSSLSPLPDHDQPGPRCEAESVDGVAPADPSPTVAKTAMRVAVIRIKRDLRASYWRLETCFGSDVPSQIMQPSIPHKGTMLRWRSQAQGRPTNRLRSRTTTSFRPTLHSRKACGARAAAPGRTRSRRSERCSAASRWSGEAGERTSAEAPDPRPLRRADRRDRVPSGLGLPAPARSRRAGAVAPVDRRAARRTRRPGNALHAARAGRGGRRLPALDDVRRRACAASAARSRRGVDPTPDERRRALRHGDDRTPGRLRRTRQRDDRTQRRRRLGSRRPQVVLLGADVRRLPRARAGARRALLLPRRAAAGGLPDRAAEGQARQPLQCVGGDHARRRRSPSSSAPRAAASTRSSRWSTTRGSTACSARRL